MKQINKSECCGCAACVQCCPKECISITEDSEGFLYPTIDHDLCINCGLCERVCPFKNEQDSRSPIDVYAGQNPNIKDLLNSSSGGVFITLAKEVLKKKGVVFGAIFDSSWEVFHTYAEKVEDVFPMMGSKYVQSRIGNCYKKAKAFLDQNRLVMFVGTPCQIRGLKLFLKNRKYENLICADVICHGVPSPGVWRRYLAETYGGYNVQAQSRHQATAGKNTVLLSSLNATSPIGDIKFRDKRESGWKKFRFVIRQKSASKADQNTVLSSDIHVNNLYMKGFLADLYLRPSCSRCVCKNGKSQADISLGDFWGIENVSKSFDITLGVSCIISYNKKGTRCIDLLRNNGYVLENRILSEIKQYNPAFYRSVIPNKNRNVFFKKFNQNKDLRYLIVKYSKPSFKDVLKNILRKLLKS